MIVKAVQKDNYSSKNNGDGNDIIYKYIENITTMSKSTAYEYQTRLNIFKAFISKEFHDSLTVDTLINKIKEGIYDPYDILSA